MTPHIQTSADGFQDVASQRDCVRVVGCPPVRSCEQVARPQVPNVSQSREQSRRCSPNVSRQQSTSSHNTRRRFDDSIEWRIDPELLKSALDLTATHIESPRSRQRNDLATDHPERFLYVRVIPD